MSDNGTIEREIENLLEQLLKSEGWITDFGEPRRNVYHQSPRTEKEKKKIGKKRPDFCLYFNETSSFPEIIAETKKPGMNLEKTKKQTIRYAKKLGSKIIMLFDGINVKHYWVENGELLKDDGGEVLSVKGADFYRKFTEQNSNDYQNPHIVIETKAELIKVFAFTNQKLRKAGILKGIERFMEFSNLLFLKLVSEENDIISENIPRHLVWDFYKNKEGEELLEYINNSVIPALEKIFNREGKETLFRSIKIEDPKALKEIVDHLSQLDLMGIKTDIKGDAFEYFIQQYNTSNNDLGEYFTPRHIVKFLIHLANPQLGEKVYDPFCGTGGILIAAFGHIKDNISGQKSMTDGLLADLKEQSVFGSEISSNAGIAKMNMILTGDGHNNIIRQDTLMHPVTEKYDVVITNIPFNLEGTNETGYSLLSKDGNTQSIQHVIDSLKKSREEFRAFVIVPEAVLNNREAKNLRKHLIENNLVKQIISLPSGVFLPYTEAKSSILVLQGYNNSPVENIKYTRIKNDGYTLTQRRREIKGCVSDLEEYLFDNTYQTRDIPISEIEKDEDTSLIWFKYFNDVPEGHIILKDIIEEERIPNSALYKTATVTKKDFWGIVSGEEYWGESFMSVTSETNEDYKVVNEKSIAYNPSRANIGSLAINQTGKKVAVSKMYVTFKISNLEFLPEYVYLCLIKKEGIQNIIDRSFGSVRQSLRFDDLCTIPIPNISIPDQKNIVDNVVKTYRAYSKNKESLRVEKSFW